MGNKTSKKDKQDQQILPVSTGLTFLHVDPAFFNNDQTLTASRDSLPGIIGQRLNLIENHRTNMLNVKTDDSKAKKAIKLHLKRLTMHSIMLQQVRFKIEERKVLKKESHEKLCKQFRKVQKSLDKVRGRMEKAKEPAFEMDTPVDSLTELTRAEGDSFGIKNFDKDMPLIVIGREKV